MPSPVTGGLILNLDASEQVSVSGGLVTSWGDLSGHGNHAAQSTPANQPIYLSSSDFSDKPALRFSGNQYLQLVKNDLLRSVPYAQILYVIKFTATSASNQTFFSATTASGSSRFQIRVNPSTNRFLIGGRRLDSDSFQSLSVHADYAMVVGTKYTLWAQADWFTSREVTFFKMWTESAGGAVQSGIFCSAAGFTEDTDSTSIRIGSQFGGEFLYADIAEIMVYNRRLTDSTELLSIGTYLYNKYYAPTSTVTKTMGVGADFSDIKTAIDWINTQPRNVRYVIDQISDINGPFFPTATILQWEREIVITCSYNESHKDNHLLWYRYLSANSGSGGNLVTVQGPSGGLTEYGLGEHNLNPVIVVEYIKFDISVTVSSLNYLQILGLTGYVGSRVNNCIFLRSLSSANTRAIICDSEFTHIYNCIVKFGSDATVSAILIRVGYSFRLTKFYIYNCVVDGSNAATRGVESIHTGTIYGPYIVMKNVAIFNCTTAAFSATSNQAIVENCATNDTSLAPYGLTNVTTSLANEFMYTVPTNRRWLKLKVATLYNSGTSVSSYQSNLTDFSGTLYETPYPIGIYQISLEAEFSADSTTLSYVGIVNFTDLSIHLNPILWEWDFGDGTPVSYDQNPSHEYIHSGYFTVILTIFDGVEEVTETKVNYIYIAKKADSLLESDFFADNRYGVESSLVVNFKSLADNYSEIISWDWNFGDKSPHSALVDPSHEYTIGGSFTVSLTVSDGISTITETKSAYITIGPVDLSPKLFLAF